MSKVTYLLGAGASYGSRNKETGWIERGLPIISEFPQALDQLIFELGDHNPYSDKESKLVEELQWLKQKCIEYPTIDTYAKILYVNGTGTDSEYLHLKRVLALFFLLFQNKEMRDLRYDNFIASLIGKNKELPPIDILTWNYDAQLEFAFSEYFSKEGVENLWRNRLNVMNKTYFHTYFAQNEKFSITKLNGTAFFEKNKDGRTRVIDMLLSDMTNEEKIEQSKHILLEDYDANNLDLPQSGISYVWENGLDSEILPTIEHRIANTEVLVVIGYSFPYVNRPTDKRLLVSMDKLRKIYIQDPRAKQIAETIMTLCPLQKEQIVCIDSNNQFIIPYELDL